MEYRKKGDGEKPKYREKNTPNTDDAYRPPTRGGRGRGDRGDRPQTGRGGASRGRGGQDKPRGGNENARGGYENPRGGRGGHDRGARQTYQGAKRALDENSWQWRYQNEERPVLEKMTVTIETVLPALPKDILKEPSRDEFNKKMKDLDAEAEQLKITVEENKFKRRQVYEGGKVEGENVTYREVITENIEEVKKYRANKKEHLDKLNDLRDKQRDLESQKSKFLDNIPRNYHNKDDLQQAIKQKKKQYETTSMSNQDEKRLLQEIDKLERALPDMEKLSAIEPELAKIRDARKKIQAELDVVKRFIEGKEEII